jgi:hypothetical protein
MLKRILAGGLLLALIVLGSGCGACKPQTTRAGCCPPPPCCPPGGGAAVVPPAPVTAGFAPAYGH